MKSLMSAIRRGGIVSITAASALALTACSAGQVTQTADMPVGIDGRNVQHEDPNISLLAVTVELDDVTGDAHLAFSATNQDPGMQTVQLESVTVDGQAVEMGALPALEPHCTLVGSSAERLENLPDAGGTTSCTHQVVTSLNNAGFAFGGTVPVDFNFDFGTVSLDAAVSAPILPAGQVERDYTTS